MLYGKNYGRAFLCQSSKTVSKILCTGPDMSVLEYGSLHRNEISTKSITQLVRHENWEQKRGVLSVRHVTLRWAASSGWSTNPKQTRRSIDRWRSTHAQPEVNEWPTLHSVHGDSESGWRTVITPRRTDTRNVINRCGGLKNASNKQKTKKQGKSRR